MALTAGHVHRQPIRNWHHRWQLSLSICRVLHYEIPINMKTTPSITCMASKATKEIPKFDPVPLKLTLLGESS